MSEKTSVSREMFWQASEQLQGIVWKALYVSNEDPDDLVAFCIQVDSRWRDLVDVLMPNYDWQPVRDLDLEPVAIGIATIPQLEVVFSRVPELAKIKQLTLSRGAVIMIALADQDSVAGEIIPKSPSPLN